MTPTQMARRSDALYADGTCGMTRRVLCDMVAQRESDLEDARAENSKLRELVADAHACKENDGCCEDCYADEGDCPIELRMRELGVEVDG